jgi:hypothetical protein
MHIRYFKLRIKENRFSEHTDEILSVIINRELSARETTGLRPV